MSIISQIESALKSINQARFQDLINHLLHIKGYKFISAPGSVVGKEKTSKGTPDSFFVNGDNYVFVECTTKEKLGNSKSFIEKLIKDIENCFDSETTKIPNSKIELVILACTEKVSVSDYNLLKEKVHSNNPAAKLELYTIQRLPMEIYDFPGLSEQYVGVEIVKGEIYNLPDFLLKSAKGLQPSLLNEFVGREAELKKAVECLSSCDILLLSGSSGVGKSKLAITVLEEMSKQDYIPIVIQSSAVPLWDDFVNLFQNGKNYVILFDDANKSPQNLIYLIDFIQKPKRYQLKVVITARDYVKQKVTFQLKDSRYKEMGIDIFKDEDIEKIITKVLPNLIYYTDVKRKIIELAKGNARVALMAAYSAGPESETNYLSSPVKLYEKYFEKIADELDVFSQPIMLQALAIVYFFGVVERENEELRHILKSDFDLDWDELWDAIMILHAHEVLDVYDKSIVKVADQVLGTYSFYKCFIDDNTAAIDYGKWILAFTPTYSYRIRSSLVDANNTFNHDHIKELVLPHINKALLNETNEDGLYSLYSMFWFYKGYETLKYIRKWIQLLPSEDVDSEIDFNFESNNHTKASKYFELLINFWQYQDELLKPALDLAIELTSKQPKRIGEFLKFINECFSYKVQDLENGYIRQNLLLDVLLDQRLSATKKRIAEGTFFNISEKLLGWHFTDYGRSKGKTFTFINFDLYKSFELLQLRRRILEGLLEAFEVNQQKSNKLLEKIVRPGGKIDATIYLDELPFYQKIVSEKLHSSNLAHCKFVKRLSKKLEAINVIPPQEWESFMNSNILKLSLFLKPDWDYERGMSINEREKEKKMEFEKFVFSKNWEQIESILYSIDELYKQQPDNSKWYIVSATSDFYITIARKGKDELIRALRLFFSGAISLPLQTRVIQFIINEDVLSGKDLYSVINEYDFEGKPFWTIALLNALPDNQVDIYFLDLLIKTVKDSTTSLPIYKMTDFLKYQDVFADYSKIEPDLINSNHNIISFLTSILLKKKESQRISLGFEFCQDCSKYFKNHIALFKEAFIYLKANEAHFDYNGNELNRVLDLDKNFLVEYLSQDSINRDYLSFKFDDFHLDYVWSFPEFQKTIENAMDIIIHKVPYYSNWAHPVCRLFTFENATDELNLKVFDFIENYITQNYSVKQKILVIMNVVMHRFPSQFIRFLKQILLLTKDVNYLKSMQLDKGGVYTGSRIPHIQREMDFCQEIIQMIKTLPEVLDYSDHIQYLEQKIDWLKQDKIREQKREFQEEYY